MAPDQEKIQAEIIVSLWSLLFAMRELLVKNGLIERDEIMKVWRTLPSRLVSGKCPELAQLVSELYGEKIDPADFSQKRLRELFTGQKAH